MAKAIKHMACPACREAGRDRSGDNLVVYSDGGLHCFSCGYHKGGLIHDYNPVKEKFDDQENLLPRDASREIPAAIWKWLLQYQLPPSYWQPFICYSEEQQRLIFAMGTPPSFYTGRYFGDDKKPKWFHYGNPHRTPIIFGLPEKAVEIVLVEDPISAHKVAYGQEARVVAPLFGTRVVDPFIPVLRHFRLPICMWLDKDQEQHAQKRASRLSMLTGQKVRYVFSTDDPKSLSFVGIKKVLDKH